MKKILEMGSSYIKIILLYLTLYFWISPSLYAAFGIRRPLTPEEISDFRLGVLGFLIVIVAIAFYWIKPFWNKFEKTIGLSILIVAESAILWGIIR